MRNGEVYCEECGTMTKGKWEIDHIRADGLLGEPTIENAMLLCRGCHVEKTASDVAQISKAKRSEAAALGIKSKRSQLKSRNTLSNKTESGSGSLRNKTLTKVMPRRAMFVDE
jgi:hypothetical protein